MNGRRLTPLLAALGVLTAGAAGIDDIARRLGSYPCVAGTVRYEVYMPSAADPVVYTIDMVAAPVEGDTLAPCNYLIEWTLPRGERVSKGFTSYGGGVHFRYRDTKLQEYHYAEDPRPFEGVKGGVQNTAQFAGLLPRFLGRRLAGMAADTTYRSSFDAMRMTLDGTQSVNGYDALEYTCQFDPETCLPVQLDLVYNPASISEQSVTAKFEWRDVDCPTIDEVYLTDRYPDVFDRFRTSNFRVENLRNTPLPTYAAYTPARQRVSYDRGTALDMPSMFVFLDPAVRDNAGTVSAVRQAVASLPMTVRTFYVFGTNDADAATSTVGALTDSESVLISARGLARDCGITAWPTILIVGSDGLIADSVVGVNKDLSGIVTQKMILTK